MDATAAFALLAAVLAVVAAVLGRSLSVRERHLADLRRTLGVDGGTDEDLARRLGEVLAAARRAQASRETAGRDLSILLEAMGVGVIRTDANLVVTAANRPAHAIVGRARDAMVGRPLVEALVEPRIEAIARAALVGGRGEEELTLRAGPPPPAPRAQVVGRTAPGAPTVVAAAGVGPTVRVASVPAAGGGAWVLLDDVSELLRLRRIRAEFVDNLSHELRTPVTTIGLLVESLARDAEVAGDAVPERMRDRIRKVEVEAGHLGQMVAELLDLARIESGGVSALTDEIDLVALARASAARLQPFAEREGVALDVVAPEAVPAVLGDEARLGQVVTNLVHNAIKFSGGQGRVTVSVRAEADEVVVSIADEGIGIRVGDQARIFERFYKVDRARVRGGGTGLGLAIARHIVESHRGRIWLVSAEGKGSTFSFAIPVRRRDPGDGATADAAVPAPTSHGSP